MQASVKLRFRGFNEPFEGAIPYMYLDIKGLVTVGVGNLVDPVSEAKSLPFQWKNNPSLAKHGQMAAPDEIDEEWQRLKKDTSLAKKGHLACEKITNLELTNAAVDDLIATRLTQNETFLKKQLAFKDFDAWPADAQMGLLSMAWAMGPGGPVKFMMFCAACKDQTFDGAADNCKMNETGNPGIIPRNQANKQLFKNAAAVIAGEAGGVYQRAILYYPKVLVKPVVMTTSGS